MARLGEPPTVAELEAAYLLRGAQIVDCDAARRLAVETLQAERALQDRWIQATRPRARRWYAPWRQ